MNIRLLKENWLSVLLTMFTLGVVVFIAIIAGRILPVKDDQILKKDTIYIERSITDSLLLNISKQVHEINNKLTPKRVYINKNKQKNADTLHIDAHIHMENK